MIAVILTLSNGEGDELTVGPFSQGVVCVPGSASIEDVASRRFIARAARGRVGGPTRWLVCYWAAPEVEPSKLWDNIFITAASNRTQARLTV